MRTAAKYAFPRHTGPAATARLAQLQIPLQALLRVVHSARYARQNAGLNPLMPTAAAGTYGYYEALEELRRSLLSTGTPFPGHVGWEHDRSDPLRKTVNKSVGIAIVVASGDEFTGKDVVQDPRTISEKGPHLMRHIVRNRAGIGCIPLSKVDLFMDNSELDLTAPKPIMALDELWLLLIASDKCGGGAELSMPLGMECGSTISSLMSLDVPKSKVVDFGERIIIQPPTSVCSPLIGGDGPTRGSPKSVAPRTKPVVEQSDLIDFDL